MVTPRDTLKIVGIFAARTKDDKCCVRPCAIVTTVHKANFYNRTFTYVSRVRTVNPTRSPGSTGVRAIGWNVIQEPGSATSFEAVPPLA